MKKRFIYPVIAALCLTALAAGGCSKEETVTGSSSASSASAGKNPSSTPAATPEASPTEDPSTMGEGAAPTDMPELESAIARSLNETCEFTKDGQSLYTVTITGVSFTDRRAVVDTEEPDKILLVTYTYQSLTDDPVLVDDMSFRCIINDTEVAPPYYLSDQVMPELSVRDQPVTAELAYNVPANTEKAALYLTNTSNPEGDSFLVTASSIQ